MNQVDTASWTCVDDFVEAYESSYELGNKASLLDFLPSQDHDLYRQVASELIRVDMEYSWKDGGVKRLSEYQALIPSVFSNKEVVQQVAFEEYRLRFQAGEEVTAEAYGRQYGIETANWPRWDVGRSPDHHRGNKTDKNKGFGKAELWQEAIELVDDAQSLPVVGEEFLGFLLEGELGRGAFAHVFLAQQGELSDRRVVLKIASGHSLEPQHLARLQHTNIVPIYSVHRKENLTAVCMPYLGKRTLADLLVTVRENADAIRSEQNLISTFLNRDDPTELMRHDSLSEVATEPVIQSKEVAALSDSSHVDAVVWLMKQLADGIAHAHWRGIIHRDIKPANVLLTDEGLPMILDFNLSEDIVVNGQASLLVGGTLPYMSLEHIEAVSTGSKVGSQTDIFSLGVIFFELLTGSRPFPDYRGAFDDVVQKMIADRKQEAPLVCEMNPSISPAIASVVQKCLTPDLHIRYRTANELVEDLSRHLSHQPLRYAADRSIVERSKKWLKRHPKLSSGGGVAAVASVFLMAMLTLWFFRGERLARIEAESTFGLFQQEQPSLYMALGVPYSELEILTDSIATTQNALATYGVLDEDDWRNKKIYTSLNKTDRNVLDRRLSEQLYLLARANEKLTIFAKNTDQQAGLVDGALELNSKALELSPKQKRPHALLAQRADLLDLQGSSEAANTLRQQAKDQDTEDVIGIYSQVYDFLDAHNYRAAKPLLIALRDRNPTDPGPWLLLGDANAALKKLEDAEACLTTAVTLRPTSHLALLHRGLCRMEKKEPGEALADFESVIAQRPDLICGYLNRALANSALNNTEEAISDLTKALDLGATQTRIYFIRSQLRQKLGDPEGAKQDFSKGLESTPSDELSWIARGIARLKTDPALALSDFQQALSLNPVSISALRNMVHVLADQLNEPQEAVKALNQILDINKNDPQALAGRSVLYAREGNREAALADVQQLLKVSKVPQSLFQAACTFSLTSSKQEKDLRKAMLLLSRSVQLEPSWLARAYTDPDLEALRQTEGFKTFVTDYRKLNALKMNLNNN